LTLSRLPRIVIIRAAVFFLLIPTFAPLPCPVLFLSPAIDAIRSNVLDTPFEPMKSDGIHRIGFPRPTFQNCVSNAAVHRKAGERLQPVNSGSVFFPADMQPHCSRAVLRTLAMTSSTAILCTTEVLTWSTTSRLCWCIVQDLKFDFVPSQSHSFSRIEYSRKHPKCCLSISMYI
jgi:hypothetical protein